MPPWDRTVFVPAWKSAARTADGDLTISGDLDLSGYRYGPGAIRPTRPGAHMGEPGVLLIRAKGNLNVHGSINDGFAPPLSTDEDSRAWRLVGRLATNNPNGVDLWQQSIIVPKSITCEAPRLASPRRFQCRGRIAELRRAAALQRHQGPRAHADRGPTRELFQPARWHELGGAVTTPDGTVYPAGTIVAANLLLEPGTTLAAGFMADQSITVAPFTLPKGTRRWASSTCSLRCRAT